MNIPAFDGSLMLDDFAEVTEISSPFWLGISRDNIAGDTQIKNKISYKF